MQAQTRPDLALNASQRILSRRLGSLELGSGGLIVCIINRCENRALARGLCRSHYNEFHHNGSLNAFPKTGRLVPISKPIERFLRKLVSAPLAVIEPARTLFA